MDDIKYIDSYALITIKDELFTYDKDMKLNKIYDNVKTVSS